MLEAAAVLSEVTGKWELSVASKSAALVGLFYLLVASSAFGASPAPAADVRADLNHDGVVSMGSMADKRLEGTRGDAAIVLPNLDDDARRCPRKQLKRYTDRQLATCNDASDNVVDGRKDLADMAKVRVHRWRRAPVGTRARISVRASEPKRARLFLRRSGSWKSLGSSGRLTARQLRRGPRLRIEARDIVRNRSRWNGNLRVVLRVRAHRRIARDSVRFRVAPVLFQNHTMPLRSVFASGKMDPSDEEDTEAADVPFPNADERRKPIDDRTFTKLNIKGRADYRDQYRRALRRWAPPGVRLALLPSPDDRWMQDFYEPGYVSMPKPNGRQHVMTMVLRSATKNRGTENPPPGHLMRQGSRIVYSHLRGPGVGVVQAYDPRRMRGLPQLTDSLSSTGNFEAIPPYSHGGQQFPDGRPIYGEGAERKPDPNFIRMLRAQGTRPLVVNTNWLTVAHVDEFVSFVPNDSKRGWTIAVEDPHAGLLLLKRLQAEGHGRARVFGGLARVGPGNPPKPVPATRTVDSLLADKHIRDATHAAARHIDSDLAKIQRATGVKDGQVIRVPDFYENDSGAGLDSAIPGTVNGVPLRPGVFAAPRPHGPVINGHDAFQTEIEHRFAEHGVHVSWVEDWYYAHLLLGDVHCTSNVLRDPHTAAPWWR
jgi:protein-arginine deiminase (PAD)